MTKGILLVLGLAIFSASYGRNENIANVAGDVSIDNSEIDRSLHGGVASYAEALSKARPAVVSVHSTKIVEVGLDPMLRRFFGEGNTRQQPMQGMGSGVIVSSDGYILTNNHVIDRADEVKVKLEDGREYDAVVVGTDPKSDIAVVKIEADDLVTATIADSEQLEVGDVVFAIGNPLGIGQTATMGIVSATGRSNLYMIDGGYENFIQTDASINRGNSGGALVDAQGRLIGINTMILTDGRASGNIGIGFAVPSNLAYAVMKNLVETGSVSRGFLGVAIQDLDSDMAETFGLDSARGALVTQVTPDSPADEADLLPGDIILSVNDDGVDSPGDLKYLIGKQAPGSEVELGLVRDGNRLNLGVVLAELDDKGVAARMAPSELLVGVDAQGLNDELREKYGVGEDVQGIVITGVNGDSPYANQLPEGLVITSINGEKVSSLSGAREQLEQSEKNRFLILYRGIYRYLVIEVE